jgi:hypothetical protein
VCLSFSENLDTAHLSPLGSLARLRHWVALEPKNGHRIWYRILHNPAIVLLHIELRLPVDAFFVSLLLGLIEDCDSDYVPKKPDYS